MRLISIRSFHLLGPRIDSGSAQRGDTRRDGGAGALSADVTNLTAHRGSTVRRHASISASSQPTFPNEHHSRPDDDDDSSEKITQNDDGGGLWMQFIFRISYVADVFLTYLKCYQLC